MFKAVIIDDERLARNELKKLLADFSEVEIIGEAANAKEGIEKIDDSPQIWFSWTFKCRAKPGLICLWK